MPLKKYQEKRNFKKSKEPKGKKRSSGSHRLYVIQKHAASHLHYDLRLELDGVLLSWAVPKGPCLDPSVKRLAVHVEDHPVDYAHFEGDIPKGEYGGGTVMLWDRGEWQSDSDPRTAYKKGDLTFVLQGEKLKGGWKLIRIKSDPKNWLLMKVEDRYAKPLSDYDILLKKNKSVKSKKTIEQLTKEDPKPIKKKTIKKKASENWEVITPIRPLPASIHPELATLVNTPPERKHWLHEIKFDGYRLLTFINNKNHIRLMTRGQKDWTTKLGTVAKAIKKLALSNTILDGEVVVLDKHHHSNFQLLQNSLQENQQDNFIYYVFDIIYYDGHDLTQLPLIERKKLLSTIVTSSHKGILRYSDHIEGSGKKVFKKSCELALEGIISKRKDSPYLEKRTSDWVKVKCLQRQEFIVVGYTPPQGTRQYFGSLLLAIQQGKKLIYCGHVGTGFNLKSLREINQQLKEHKTSKMALSSRPPESKNVTWIKPTLVVEVEFSEWTKDGILRHPSFKGIRIDKPTKAIQQELPKTITQRKQTMQLTNPDKVLYPESGITKRDLYEYYKNAQDWILPYISKRPLTLLRCPDSHKQFYQKHMNASMPNTIHSISIGKKTQEENYLYIEDSMGLLTLAQLAVLEIHPWGSTIESLDCPDILIFDLDPAPEVKWKNVVEAAFLIKSTLAEFKLKSYVKSTGGKGLHVVVPITPEYSWEEIKIYAHTLVQYLVSQFPHQYTAALMKSKRSNKIFIDYLRNQKGATAIAPYSTRALPDATVAVPLHWDELTNRKKDTTYTIKTVFARLDRLKRDPWHDFFNIKQSLKLNKLK